MEGMNRAGQGSSSSNSLPCIPIKAERAEGNQPQKDTNTTLNKAGSARQCAEAAAGGGQQKS
jgi:hypothetical protein